MNQQQSLLLIGLRFLNNKTHASHFQHHQFCSEQLQNGNNFSHFCQNKKFRLIDNISGIIIFPKYLSKIFLKFAKNENFPDNSEFP